MDPQEEYLHSLILNDVINRFKNFAEGDETSSNYLRMSLDRTKTLNFAIVSDQKLLGRLFDTCVANIRLEFLLPILDRMLNLLARMKTNTNFKVTKSQLNNLMTTTARIIPEFEDYTVQEVALRVLAVYGAFTEVNNVLVMASFWQCRVDVFATMKRFAELSFDAFSRSLINDVNFSLLSETRVHSFIVLNIETERGNLPHPDDSAMWVDFNPGSSSISFSFMMESADNESQRNTVKIEKSMVVDYHMYQNTRSKRLKLTLKYPESVSPSFAPTSIVFEFRKGLQYEEAFKNLIWDANEIDQTDSGIGEMLNIDSGISDTLNLDSSSRKLIGSCEVLDKSSFSTSTEDVQSAAIAKGRTQERFSDYLGLRRTHTDKPAPIGLTAGSSHMLYSRAKTARSLSLKTVYPDCRLGKRAEAQEKPPSSVYENIEDPARIQSFRSNSMLYRSSRKSELFKKFRRQRKIQKTARYFYRFLPSPIPPLQSTDE